VERLTWDFAQAEPVQDRYWHISRRPRGQVHSSLIRPDSQDRRRSRTGVYYRKDTYSKGRASGSRSAPAPSATPTYPKASVLAPKAEKVFAKGSANPSLRQTPNVGPEVRFLRRGDGI
jgi:hypothetical protein